jgi:alpha-tubulin suppressor-like RCC1 family protein
VDISSNYSHSLALVEQNGEKKVYSWGLNLSNQLGRSGDNKKPALIENLKNIEKVFAGYRSSFAIDNKNQVWAWGGQ